MKKILLTLLLISGCSSNPIVFLPAPNYERLSVIKGQISEGNDKNKGDSISEKLAHNYLLAMKNESSGNFKDACRLFGQLANKQDFPLNQTSLVHTLYNCQYSASELKAIWK